MNFGYATRSLDWNKLVLGDQLQFDANGNAPTTDPAVLNAGMAHYFDFDAGILAYNKIFWFGMAASHMNQPNRSVIQAQETLPVLTNDTRRTANTVVQWTVSPRTRGSPFAVVCLQAPAENSTSWISELIFYTIRLCLVSGYRGIPIRQDVQKQS